MDLVRLDGHVMRYIHEALAPPYPFAEALRRLPWEQGSLWSFVPGSDTDRWHSREAFLNFVVEYLHAGGRRAFIMSHAFPSRSAYARLLQLPRLGRAWADWCVSGDALCFYATEGADIHQIIHVLDDVQAPTTFGVLVRDVVFSWHEDLPQATLDNIIDRAEYAVLEINVYDNGIPLIWSRTSVLKAR